MGDVDRADLDIDDLRPWAKRGDRRIITGGELRYSDPGTRPTIESREGPHDRVLDEHIRVGRDKGLNSR